MKINTRYPDSFLEGDGWLEGHKHGLVVRGPLLSRLMEFILKEGHLVVVGTIRSALR